MSYVELKKVKKSFGTTKVIHGVDLTLEKEDFTVFVGPSGCGKTTLLRLIAGLEDLDEGSIFIGNERVDTLPPAQRGVAMVFQNYALYPHMSVYQNMSFGLRIAKKNSNEIEQRVKEAAEILQIKELLDRKPRALSGGQRQRVAIGRAIVREPKVFLFDEPLSNLDAKLRVQMRVELSRLHKKLKATMIYVTHDQVEAMTMGSRIVVLNNGNIEQEGPPLDLYNTPKNIFVAGFIGSPAMNFLEGKIKRIDDQTIYVELKGGDNTKIYCQPKKDTQIGDPITLGIRPESLWLDESGESQITGKVYAVERLGGETYLYINTTQQQEIIVHSPGDKILSTETEITLTYSANKCHLFDAKGLRFTI
ncbi:MAG: ABC transporter ATP-binding protein [Acidiferrobacteraceae bacterium]|nr:ABC transporter ATP-binding protein [Acidiferrobacteraceae bacterium]|tara:strand:+ start:4494 stop:5582 length:1089 start_codon:yes stop_codon:yes gene_type:complete